MPIKLPDISKAKNSMSVQDLFANRKKYRNSVLVKNYSNGVSPTTGTADFWNDRHLYGKIDRKGNIIISRESYFRTLRTRNKKTFYTLDFVALAFSQMIGDLEYNYAQNNIPNTKTVFRAISPTKAWESVYQPYHRYMVGLFDSFAAYLDTTNTHSRVRNFEDFIEEFFIFVRNSVTMYGSPITFSGFVSSPLASPMSSGLMIDLSPAKPSEDFPKKNVFVDDINFKAFRSTANRFGFAIDRNIPWRLVANLNSVSMQTFMAQPAFDVTYGFGDKNVFDKYYMKTYLLDYSLIQSYMFTMYDSLLQARESFSETDFHVCKNNVGKVFNKTINRKDLTKYEKRNKYNVRDYWLEITFRYRLLEIQNDLKEEDINYHVHRAKKLFNVKSLDHSYMYLNDIIRSLFIHQYTLSRDYMMTGESKPRPRNIVVTSMGKNKISSKKY